MADYNPPTETLPIFDASVFTLSENYITQGQADKRYLRYPNAQGTETLQQITVNGSSSFLQPITLSSTTASNRTINNTYYTLVDDTTNLQTGVIYSSGTNFIYDTNYNGAGHYFYSNTSGGVQTNPLKVTSATTTLTAGTSVINLTSNDLFLNPSGSIDCQGKTLNMTQGEIHNCPLVHSQNNNSITIKGLGNTSSVILDTDGVSRHTISGTGFHTFQGGMTYNNATNTLTAGTFNGTVTTATNANNVLVTSDNDDGTYFLPFVKSSGTGNKTLFIDDTTGPLTYNPSTRVLTYDRWNMGVPIMFDDFTSLETNGPFGWFLSRNTATNTRTIYEGTISSLYQSTYNVQYRAGLFVLQTTTSGADIVYVSGSKVFRPCSMSRIDFGFIDMESGDLSADPVTPSASGVTKTFGLSTTSTPTNEDEQNGIFFRVNRDSQTSWEMCVNSGASFGSPLNFINSSNVLRFSIIFTNGGANFNVEVWNGASTTPYGPFTSPSNLTAYYVYVHLKSRTAVTRGIALDYIKVDPASYPICRTGGVSVTR